jgi:hypothetical protein
MSVSPFEIIAGPAIVYVAPVGTSFPAVDEAPAVAWLRLGRTKGGVGAQHNQTQVDLRADQDTAPAKVMRTEESMVLTFALADLTLENFGRVLNGILPTDVAPVVGPPAVAGYRKMTMYQGLTVAQYAMLIRAPSPYLEVLIAYESLGLDYRLTRVSQSGNPSVKFVPDDMALLETEWKVISDPNAVGATLLERFGYLVACDAAKP